MKTNPKNLGTHEERNAGESGSHGFIPSWLLQISAALVLLFCVAATLPTPPATGSRGLPTTTNNDLVVSSTNFFSRNTQHLARALSAMNINPGSGGGGGTVTSVGITQPAAGLTFSGGPVTGAGSFTAALANDLLALEGLSGTGYPRRTGVDAWTLDSTITWSSISSIPTTLSGYGITDAASVSGLVSATNNLDAAKLTVNTVPSARLGSGTANSSTFLRGDGTWQTPGGGGTVTSVGITAPAAGIGVSGSPVTGSGSMTLSLANDLSALEGLSGTGYSRRTGTDAWTLDSTIPWSSISSTPTTLSGYGITDAASVSGLVSATNNLDAAKLTVNTVPSARLGSGTANSSTFLRGDGTWQTPGGGGTVTSVGITAPAAGIGVSGSPVTGSGSMTLSLANDLAALEALSGTGWARRTGTDAWTLDSTIDSATATTAFTSSAPSNFFSSPIAGPYITQYPSGNNTNFIINVNTNGIANYDITNAAVHLQQTTNRNANGPTQFTIRLTTGNTNRTFTWNSNWKWMTGTPTNLLGSNLVIVISGIAWGSSETNTHLWWSDDSPVVPGVTNNSTGLTLGGTFSGDGSGLTLANTAVTPGIYSNVIFTVDSKGRTTAASIATLISIATGNFTAANSATENVGDVILTNRMTFLSANLNPQSNLTNLTADFAVSERTYLLTNSAHISAISNGSTSSNRPSYLNIRMDNVSGSTRIVSLAAGIKRSGTNNVNVANGQVAIVNLASHGPDLTNTVGSITLFDSP